MKRYPWILAAGGAALVLAGAAVSGCSKKLTSVVLTNLLPEVRITAAPIDTSARCVPDPARSCYSLTISWVGHDADGRVDYFLFAIDPPTRVGADTVWQVTRDNEKRVTFTAGEVLAGPAGGPHVARDHHVFVIKAVDDRGAAGPAVYRAFFSFTQAPTVQIQNPLPSHLSTPLLTPSVRIAWSGRDDDGVFTQKPVKYKYILLNPSSPFPSDRALQEPDSLRRFYAPNFVGWDSTSAETTQVLYTNLTPNQRYIFVVVSIDEAGAYSPVFSLNTNMLQFRVGFAGVFGPRITMFNEFFEYSYGAGGYCACPLTEVFLELPAGRRLTVNWFAEAPPGASMRSYRWALDIDDVSDETPRRDERTDLRRWSARALNVTAVTLPPFGGGEEHRFYIEAEDNLGLRSLGIIRFQVVQASFVLELGIVDDTRLKADQWITPDCARRPIATWPMAAELDTFLFARGGFPWKCYPAGTRSEPGLFAGYNFDTLNTRIGRQDLTVRLATLGQYRHLIWMVDGVGATNFNDGVDPTDPRTALRHMTAPGRFNTLGAYVKQGGKVWMLGGGVAYASTISWDDPTNNQPTTTFSVNSRRRELVPGRFMYDLARWQSEFRISKAPATIVRYTGRFGDSASVTRPGSPYAQLPERIRLKAQSPADPIPPQRNASDFNQSTVDVEYLQQPNRIVENVSTRPDTLIERSTLDTLYRVTGPSLPRNPQDTAHNVLMTYYYGPAVPQGLVFTGFNIWNLKRIDCQGLVDFVLQRLWGLRRGSVSAAAAPAVPEAAARIGPPDGAVRAVPATGRAAPQAPRAPRDVPRAAAEDAGGPGE